jgi:hypothetical protein
VRRSSRRPARTGLTLTALVLAALVLTAAGCGNVAPLRPTPPTPGHLSTAIVLRNVLYQQTEPAGQCTSGYTPPAPAVGPPPPSSGQPGSPPTAQSVTSPADAADLCYRETGKPATFTVAAVSLIEQPAGPHGQPVSYGLSIALPEDEAGALTAVSTKAFESRQPLAIIVAGKLVGLPYTLQPITGGHFEIGGPSKNQALRIERMLLPSG